MKKIKKDLEAIKRGLRDLTKKTDSLLDQISKLEQKAEKSSVKAKSARSPKTGKKKAPSATEIVLKIISKSKRGVDTKKIQQKTGFNTRKIWDIVHKAYKEGKIKKVGRGLYVGK